MAVANSDLSAMEKLSIAESQSPSADGVASDPRSSTSSDNGMSGAASPISSPTSDGEFPDGLCASKEGGASSSSQKATKSSGSTSSAGSVGSASLFSVNLEDVEWWTGLTEEDVKSALDIDRGGVGEGWALVKESDGGKVWKKALEGQSNQMIKGVIQLPGIPAAKVVELVGSPTVRPKWDSNYNCQVLDKHEMPGSHPQLLQRLILKMPPPVTDRDFVHVTYQHESSDGEYVLLSKSVTDEAFLPKPKSKMIRAQTHLAAVLLRPKNLTDSTLPADLKKYGIDRAELSTSTELTLILHLDLFGKIPAAAVNLSVVSQPLKWRTKMLEFYHKKMKKQ